MGVWTYRIAIHGGGERMQEDLARTEITKLLKKQPGERTPRKRKAIENTTNEKKETGVPLPTAEAGNAGEVNRETDAEPSSSQSSTTTTNSSSNSRHKIKKKKTRRTRRKSTALQKGEEEGEGSQAEREKGEGEEGEGGGEAKGGGGQED